MIEFAAIEDARGRLQGAIHPTPVHTCGTLSDDVGVDLRIKAELLQKTGSFKVRGVLNRLALLSEEDRSRGLVSLSAGNHAAALAFGATAAGTTATVVMPEGASASKVAATRAYGGDVVLTARPLMDVVCEIQEEHGYVLVHPFDDDAIMAGHGTVGLEILEQAPAVSAIVVPIGGGGLIGGVSAAVKQQRPDVRVLGVEPAAADAMTRSLAAGAPIHLDTTDTIADGLAAPFAGERTLAAVQRFVDEVVTVSEEHLAEATLLFHERTKLYIEPSGAAPLAALLAGTFQGLSGRQVALIASGGNVDRRALRDLLSDPT